MGRLDRVAWNMGKVLKGPGVVSIDQLNQMGIEQKLRITREGLLELLGAGRMPQLR